jgi:nicotinamide phosphoribosyltransferase
MEVTNHFEHNDPTTVATNSREIKKIIAKYLRATADDLSELPFKLHDFGARGAHTMESSFLGGMSHLVNFMGTDTGMANLAAKHYYGADMAGYSVPATEHSTITSWTRDGEVDAYRNALKNLGKPGGIVSIVSDSYDIYNAVENIYGETLRQEIIDSGAMLVIRPDSGDPVEVLTRISSMVNQKFGYKFNNRGYMVFNNVRILWGDGINKKSIETILEAMTRKGYSATNFVFGMGGALLGAPQRDDQKFAMKASNAVVGGKDRDVFKDPITDQGKTSKKGRLSLIEEGGLGTYSYRTVSQKIAGDRDILRPIYRNGEILVDDNFDAIRERAAI